jgi:hypothetical protein
MGKLIREGREMENISRGPTFGDFVTILAKGSMQNNTVARLQSTRVQTSLSSPSIKCNVLRESFSEDSQNILCATPKRRGSWVISVYLCLSVADPDPNPGSVGSVCFWVSWIRIRSLLSSCKNSKKNLDSYCFVTLFYLFFIFEK